MKSSSTIDNGLKKINKTLGKILSAECNSGAAAIDNNAPAQENLATASKEYSSFNSLTFVVYDGTAIVTVDGVTITFPLVGSNSTVLGTTFTVEQLSDNSVTIDATAGKVYVTTIK